MDSANAGDVGPVRMPIEWLGNEEHPESYGHVWRTSMTPIEASGHFSLVYGGKWQRSDQRTEDVALKMLRDTHAPEVMRKRLKREVRVWSCLRHEHLLPLYGTCQRTVDGGVQFYLVSPLARNGNVMQFLDVNPTADRLQLVAAALVYLHSAKDGKDVIVHGDIKGQNILVSDRGTALLCDFGLATIADEQSSTTSSSFRRGGTLRFCAPELLFDDERKKTPESDVFAYAMLTYQLYAGEVPFHGQNDGQFLRSMYAEKRPERPTACKYELVWMTATLCWAQDPRLRPTMEYVAQTLSSSTSFVEQGGRRIVTRLPQAPDPPKSKTESERERMEGLLFDLQRNSHAWPFLQPVNHEEVPDYYDEIKNPMDFDTMSHKLEHNQYEGLDDFVRDANLVFLNCLAYNPVGSVYAKTALRMRQYLQELLQKDSK